MERRGRKRQARGSLLRNVWVLFFGVIFLLYVLFVVRVQFYTSSSTGSANAIGDHALENAAPRSPGRVMQESNLRNHAPAPAPALAQAATPERKKDQAPLQTQPPIQVGAIYKQPAPEIISTPPVQTPTPLTTARLVRPAAAVITPVEHDRAEGTPTNPPPSTLSATPTLTVTEQAVAAPVYDIKESFASRHIEISGYDEMNDYLARYKPREGESLFLFFACSDDRFQPQDWSELCADAKKTVYKVFAKSPPGNKLLTIYAGSERFWEFKNKFRDDQDLRIKTVPSIIKWHGYRGETSGMMVDEALTEEPFLRYLFKNTDQPDRFLTPAAMVETKTIETVSSYEAFQAKLTMYKRELRPRRSLYLLFVSGRIKSNNRPWCPYCRFSEITMEYGFKAFAPPGARLLRVEVTPLYQEWKTPNKYNQDLALGPLRSVPAFMTVRQLASQDLQMERIYERFDGLASLKTLFTTVALVKDE